MTPSSDAGIDDMDAIYFDLRNILQPGFPETPVGNQVMLFSDEQASVASPR